MAFLHRAGGDSSLEPDVPFPLVDPCRRHLGPLRDLLSGNGGGWNTEDLIGDPIGLLLEAITGLANRELHLDRTSPLVEVL